MSSSRADFYDAELRRHNEHLRAASGIGPSDRVLDIGCGAGQTTRDAARVAVAGHVLGVDVSDDLLAVARRRAADEKSHNIGFELGDAQVYDFPREHFDACISRFGVMFFANPPAAFANIASAMRVNARLVLMVWQSADRNQWAGAIQNALVPGSASSTAAAFSLGDRRTTARLLAAAGFVSVDFAEVHEPVFYGPTADAAHDTIVDLFTGPEGPTDDAKVRLRSLIQQHLTTEGVLFDSRAWIVTARKA